MSSKIHFVKLSPKSDLEERKNAMKKIFASFNWNTILNKNDKVAIKTHFGEKNNNTHIAAEVVAVFTNALKNLAMKAFLTETSTLYAGERMNAICHLNLAYEHGFTPERMGIPIIMADGLLGNSEKEIDIPGKIFSKVSIAADAILADALVLISHPTGHIVAGFGATLKNLGMGLATRKGKMAQHSSIKPFIKSEKCTLCKKCMIWCPEDAIIEKDNSAFILENKCIGCGECLSVCGFDAVRYNWGTQSDELQKGMAEYALGVLSNKKDKAVFINVLADMTKECDCLNQQQKPFIPDIGILLGTDPVAIDQATLDLTAQSNTDNLGKMSHANLDPQVQLVHAEKIGLGSRSYQLITIEK